MIGSFLKSDAKSLASSPPERKMSASSSSSKGSKEENQNQKEDSEKEFVLKEEELPSQILDEETLSHNIFEKLCPEDKYAKNNHCYVCKTKFRAFKMSKKRCKFCGYYVCGDHSKKQRPDPENKTSFARICDRCDYQHLYKVIFEDYDKKKFEKEQKIKTLETQLLDLKNVLDKKEKNLTEMKKEKQKRDEDYNENSEKLNMKIRVLQAEIKKIEKDTNELNENYTQVTQSIKEMDQSLLDLQNEYKKLQEENESLSSQITAIDKDIEQTTAIIQKIEELITQAKIERGASNVYKETYKTKNDESDLLENTNFDKKENNNTPDGKKDKNKKNDKFNKDSQLTNHPETCKNCKIF